MLQGNITAQFLWNIYFNVWITYGDSSWVNYALDEHLNNWSTAVSYEWISEWTNIYQHNIISWQLLSVRLKQHNWNSSKIAQGQEIPMVRVMKESSVPNT